MTLTVCFRVVVNAVATTDNAVATTDNAVATTDDAVATTEGAVATEMAIATKPTKHFACLP